MSRFEGKLAESSTNTSEADDRIIESTVVLYGRLARHFDSSDPRLSKVTERLIEALRTPSEVVQVAVSECLPPLVRLKPSDVPSIADRLLADLFAGSKYAEREWPIYFHYYACSKFDIRSRCGVWHSRACERLRIVESSPL